MAAAAKVAALFAAPTLPSLGPLALKNCIVMAPMTRCRADCHSGVLSDLSVEYYRQRSTAGLIITEATCISPGAHGYARTPGIYTLPHVLAWRKVTQAVHDKGSAIFLQLWHCGRLAHPLNRPTLEPPVAPSAVRAAGQIWTDQAQMQDYAAPRALSTREVHATIQEFAQAAETALSAGFDGVELHAASGYLPHQFLSSNVNQRTDAYGGNVDNRCRFVMETLEAVIEAVGGASHKVGIKLSPTVGFDIEDKDAEEVYSTLARKLKSLKLGYLHVMRGPKFDAVGLLRREYGATLIAGGEHNGESGAEALQKGQADLIAYGAAYIANPDLPERFRRGAALNPLDRNTFYSEGHKGYIDYPTLAA